MADLEPYVISVPEIRIEDLHRKLSNSSFPDELEDVAWTRGAPLAEVQRLAKYWKDEFDWRKVEVKLNELPSFRMSVQAEGFDPLKIHFVHQRSNIPGAIPLLFVHGC